MSLPNHDAWLEPPDYPEHTFEGCKDGCILDDEHDQPAQCMDRDDMREEMALQRWEEERDDRG